MVPPPPHKSHLWIWIIVGVIVAAIAVGAYFVLGIGTLPEDNSAINQQDVSALEAELQAESSLDLGSELSDIDKEIQ